MSVKIEYLESEKIKVNGKIITVTLGVPEHLEDLTTEEQKALSQFILSRSRGLEIKSTLN